jgi:hypothetical protein
MRYTNRATWHWFFFLEVHDIFSCFISFLPNKFYGLIVYYHWKGLRLQEKHYLFHMCQKRNDQLKNLLHFNLLQRQLKYLSEIKHQLMNTWKVGKKDLCFSGEKIPKPIYWHSSLSGNHAQKIEKSRERERKRKRERRPVTKCQYHLNKIINRKTEAKLSILK